MAREKNEKVWMAGGALSAVLLAGALWTFVVSPQMGDVDNLRSQTADAQTQNLALQSNVSRLREEYTHIADVKRQLADAQAQLPADSGLSALTSQLNAQARAHHVKITQVTAAPPAPYVAPTPTAGVSGAPASAGAASSGSPAGELFVIPVSVAVSGSQADELAFARAVQMQGPRSALIGSVQLQSGGGAGSTGTGTKGSSLTLQMNVYVAPVAPAVAPSPSSSAP
jgi:hypothetical protein